MARRYRFMTLDVFARERFAGNPLAVFADAEGLDDRDMQTIANEFNLSETVFILPGDGAADAHLRIFTPAVEMPFAGHPTVGAALALHGLGRVGSEMILSTLAGPVPVTIEDGRAILTAPKAPEPVGRALSAGDAAHVLGLDPGAVKGTGAYSAGAPFSIIELAGRDAVRAARADAAALDRLDADIPKGLFLFASVTDDPETDLHARMFAPTLGVAEDPATGSACAALGGYLGPGSYRVRQGVEMGRPSYISVEVDEAANGAARVRIGGAAVPVMTGALTLD